MSEPQIIFVDYPDIDPCEEDNPLCVQHCLPRARFTDDGCFSYFPGHQTLREAIPWGFVKGQSEDDYPAEWLDKRLRACRRGYKYVRLDEREWIT